MNRPCTFLLFLIVFIQSFYGSESNDRVDGSIAVGHGEELPEEENEWWTNLIRHLAGDGGDTLSIVALLFINLHFFLMRGCVGFIVRYFLPFYAVIMALLFAAYIIPILDPTDLEGARIMCYLLVIGTFTSMAFITPVYFFFLVLEGDFDEERVRVRDYNEGEDENRSRDERPPPAYDLPNYALVQHQHHLWFNQSVDAEVTANPNSENETVEDVQATQASSTSEGVATRSSDGANESSNENVGARKRTRKARGESKATRKSKVTRRQRK